MRDGRAKRTHVTAKIRRIEESKKSVPPALSVILRSPWVYPVVSRTEQIWQFRVKQQVVLDEISK
jgi:hypothetical protein